MIMNQNLTKPRRRWLIIVLIVAIITLLTISWFALARPQTAVRRALDHITTAQTADFVATLEVSDFALVQQLAQEPGDLTLMFDGAFDRTDPDNTLVSTQVTITSQTDSLSVDLKGETRLLADKVYFYLDTVPPFFTNLTPFKGRWFSFPRGQSQATANSDTNSHNDDSEQTNSTPAVTITNATKVGRDTVNNTSTVKYTATISPEGIISLSDTIGRILGTQLSTDQIKQLQANIADVEAIPVTIWVTSWSHQLKQLEATLQTPQSDSRTTFAIIINDTNQSVEITAPEEAIALDQLQQDNQ